MTPEEIKSERQMIFDTVAEHLAKQGHRAIDHAGTCRYRYDDGAKCAAGCLLSDDEYVPEMEGRMFGTIGGRKDIEWPERLLPHRHLITELQRAHDLRQVGESGSGEYGAASASIDQRLDDVAQMFGLDASLLKTLTFPKVWK